MPRSRLGAHGRVSERVNGTMMMTVRPEPVVLVAEDVAMLLGEYLNTVADPYGDEKTLDDAMTAYYDFVLGRRMWSYLGAHPKGLTQKFMLERVLTGRRVMEYEAGEGDRYAHFNEDDPTHQFTLELVYGVYPAFAQNLTDTEAFPVTGGEE